MSLVASLLDEVHEQADARQAEILSFLTLPMCEYGDTKRLIEELEDEGAWNVANELMWQLPQLLPCGACLKCRLLSS